MRILVIAVPFLLVMGCAPKVKTHLTKNVPTLDYRAQVHVLSLEDSIPSDAVEVGTVKVGDSGFTTRCSWDDVMGEAVMEARKAGGNVLKITEHKPAGVGGSSCHRIVATIYTSEEMETLQAAVDVHNQVQSDTSKQSPIASAMAPADTAAGPATLYLYRPGGMGPLITYDVHLGDSVLWRARNKTRLKIQLPPNGRDTLWAKTESKDLLPIVLEPGKEYYIRCTVKMGVMVGRPELELIGPMQGNMEFNSTKIKWKN